MPLFSPHSSHFFVLLFFVEVFNPSIPFVFHQKKTTPKPKTATKNKPISLSLANHQQNQAKLFYANNLQQRNICWVSRYKHDLMIQQLMSEKLARSLSSLCYLTLVPGQHAGPTRGDHKSHTGTWIRLLDYQLSSQSSAQCYLCSCNSPMPKQAWGEGRACPFQSRVNKNYAHLLRRYALEHDV